MQPLSGARIVPSSNEIHNKIMKGYVSDINKHIRRAIPKMKRRLAPFVFNAIFNSPEMLSLRGGKLRIDLGVVNDPSYMISEKVSDSVEIQITKFKYIGGAITGGAKVNIQPTDNLNVLTMPESTYITEKGVEIPWLDWLLNYGDKVIILDFGVTYKPGGRTGGGIMTPRNAPFQVDPRFSGVQNDNFITRALNKTRKKIEGEIWNSIVN